LTVHFGGNWNNGTNVSPFYWNGNNSPTNTNINIGGRLIRILLKKSATPCEGEIAQANICAGN